MKKSTFGINWYQVKVVPRNRKKGKSIDEFINRTVGEPGSKEREQFEAELKSEIDNTD